MKTKKIGLILALLSAVISFSAIAAAETVVHGFKAQASLVPGWIVALDKADSGAVLAAPAEDPERIYGVVIDPNDAPLTVQKQDQQVFVATSGNYPVLASTENGSIIAGDYLTLSSTDGIAAKAGSDSLFVVGRALESFSGDTNTIVRKNNSAIGYMRIQLSPGKNPILKEAASVPQPLRRVGESIAGKPVSPLRIYAGLAIFLISGLIAAVMLWGGIKNGLVAIGRNPLSRHSIMKGLLQVIVAAALVLIIGLLGVYLLLKV